MFGYVCLLRLQFALLVVLLFIALLLYGFCGVWFDCLLCFGFDLCCVGFI